MRRLVTLLLGIFVLSTGCMRLPSLIGAPTAGDPGLSGIADWEGFSVQATSTEVAQGATVSLIEPNTGNTVATTLTQPNGSFTLTFNRWAPVTNKPYLLEALKGLSSNRVGMPAARVRTLVSKVNGTWTSLTGPTIKLSRGTTALCLVASLKGMTTPQQQALMNSLTANSGPPETYAATPDLPGPDYAAVWELVNTALGANQDPLRVIAKDANNGQYLRLERGPLVTDVSATSGAPGEPLVLYGNGFDPVARNNRVFFGGVEATDVTLNGDASQLTVIIPESATGGPLTVRVGNLVMLVPFSLSIMQPTVRTLAGLGDPTGSPATGWNLAYPFGMATDGAGGVYFSTKTQVLRIAPEGTIALVAGHASSGYFGDRGPAANALLNLDASDIALDAAGNLYLADQLNHRIRMVPKTAGTYFGQAMAANSIYTIAGNGVGTFSGDGAPATAASLYNPAGVAVDASGNLYIADKNNHRIRMVPRTAGTYFGQVMAANALYTIAGSGVGAFSGDGDPATTASLYYPRNVELDAEGNLFIADQSNNRIRMVPQVSGTCFGQAMIAHHLYTVAGNGSSSYAGSGVLATTAALRPSGLAVDPSGNLFFADTSTNNRVRMVARTDGSYYGQARTTGYVYTLVGIGGSSFDGDGGPANSGKINSPEGIAFDATGNLFIADTNRRIRMVPRNGGTYYGQAMTALYLYSIAGNATSGPSGEGTAALSSALSSPNGLARDADGNLFIVDSGNLRIRMIPRLSGTYFGKSMVANYIYTVAGNGISGFGGDGGPALNALFSSLKDLAVDSAGNLFIADNTRIRMVVRSAGTYFGQAMTANYIYTIAGGGAGGDGGPAAMASISLGGLAIDGAGNLYMTHNNRQIRMIPRVSGTYFGQAMTADYIYTIAGTTSLGYAGDGGPATAARLYYPGVTVDGAGNLFIADDWNDRVRMVPCSGGTYFGQAMTAGYIYTIAGTGTGGYSGDGGPGTAAAIDGPTGIAVDPAGNVLFVDRGNQRIRMLVRTAGTHYSRTTSANRVYTLVGNGAMGYNGDGPGDSVSLYNATEIVAGPAELFFCDLGNHLVRKVF